MNAFTPADTLHRLVKQALDSGAAATLAEAENLFRGYRVCFSIGTVEATQREHQIALLDRRCARAPRLPGRRLGRGRARRASPGAGRLAVQAWAKPSAFLAPSPPDAEPADRPSHRDRRTRPRSRGAGFTSARSSMDGAAAPCRPMWPLPVAKATSCRSRRCSPPRRRSARRSFMSRVKPQSPAAGRSGSRFGSLAARTGLPRTLTPRRCATCRRACG